MVEVVKVSKLYETDPEGGPPQDKFLDGAAEVLTHLTPHELLALLKVIEKKIGRTPSKVKWGPREIDLDILLYDGTVMNEHDLVIPHPQLHLRRFMIEPLSEISPDAVHPVLNKTASEILRGFEIRPNQI